MGPESTNCNRPFYKDHYESSQFSTTLEKENIDIQSIEIQIILIVILYLNFQNQRISVMAKSRMT